MFGSLPGIESKYMLFVIKSCVPGHPRVARKVALLSLQYTAHDLLYGVSGPFGSRNQGRGGYVSGVREPGETTALHSTPSPPRGCVLNRAAESALNSTGLLASLQSYLRFGSFITSRHSWIDACSVETRSRIRRGASTSATSSVVTECMRRPVKRFTVESLPTERMFWSQLTGLFVAWCWIVLVPAAHQLVTHESNGQFRFGEGTDHAGNSR